MTGVYLHVFHGRDSTNESMDDWGFDGPVIGPLQYVHTTYACEIKFACSGDVADKFFPDLVKRDREAGIGPGHEFEGQLPICGDCLYYQGKFYGDWSVFGPELLTPEGGAS